MIGSWNRRVCATCTGPKACQRGADSQPLLLGPRVRVSTFHRIKRERNDPTMRIVVVFLIVGYVSATKIEVRENGSNTGVKYELELSDRILSPNELGTVCFR